MKTERKRGRKPAGADGILDAACRAFSDKGYYATTVEDVMTEAGVGKGTVYRHFRSKEGLLLAALCRASGEMDTCVASAISKSKTLREKLTGAAEGVLSYCAAHPEFLRLFIREGALSIPSVRRAMRDVARESSLRIAKLLGGHSRLPEAAVFNSLIFGLVRRKLGFADETIHPAKDAAFLVSMFLDGFRGRNKS